MTFVKCLKGATWQLLLIYWVSNSTVSSLSLSTPWNMELQDTKFGGMK